MRAAHIPGMLLKIGLITLTIGSLADALWCVRTGEGAEGAQRGHPVHKAGVAGDHPHHQGRPRSFPADLLLRIPGMGRLSCIQFFTATALTSITGEHSRMARHF